MSVLDLMKRRCSVRKFKNKPVTREELMAVLEASRVAPSACNLQPWRFVVVTDREKIEKFDPQDHQPWVERAPAVIVVCANPMDSWEKYGADDDCFILDTAAAIENMLLAIHALGLGGVWILSFSKEAVRETLGIPNPWKIVSIVPFGYYDPDGVSEYKGRRLLNSAVRPRRPLGEVAFLNSPDEPLEE